MFDSSDWPGLTEAEAVSQFAKDRVAFLAGLGLAGDDTDQLKLRREIRLVVARRA